MNTVIQEKERFSTRREFQETIFPYMDEIFEAAGRLTQSQSEAEELAEETFAKARSIFHQFEHGNNIRVWLYQVLMGEMSRNAKNNSHGSNTDIVPAKPPNIFSIYIKMAETMDSDQCSPAQTLMANISESDILNALRSLPEGFRETVILADFQKLSYQEIALSLNISTDFVRFRLNLGRHYFQKALWDEADALGPDVEKSEELSPESFSLERA